MASRLLVLGARPFGITPGGGCRALFITLLQLATIVRMVSDSSWDTLLKRWKKSWIIIQHDSITHCQIPTLLSHCESSEGKFRKFYFRWTQTALQSNSFLPSTRLQAGQHGSQCLWGKLGTFWLVLVWSQTTHNGRTAPLQECHTCLDERLL